MSLCPLDSGLGTLLCYAQNRDINSPELITMIKIDTRSESNGYQYHYQKKKDNYLLDCVAIGRTGCYLTVTSANSDFHQCAEF